MRKVFRHFESTILDAADEDDELLSLIIALDHHTWDEDWDRVFGRQNTDRFCEAGFKHFGDIVKLSKSECQKRLLLTDEQVNQVEELISAVGLTFEMDTSIWDEYRKEVPRGYFAMRLPECYPPNR